VTRRFMLSLALAALGTGLLAASVLAGGASPVGQAGAVAKGGTFRILNTNDFDHIDPALAYFSQSWTMEAATQLRLYYYPLVAGPRNQRIEPMAAAAMPRISGDGKTYSIAVKRGFKFSNGENVTAASFKRAFDRALNDKLQSPAESFLDDVAGVRTTGAFGLQVRLKRVAPDFLARITMPFFSAVTASTPVDAEVTKGPLHSAGPYYIREWNKGTSALAVRNPQWSNAKEPFKSLGFANNVDRITWSGFQGDLATHRLQCERSEADWCDFPSAQAKELADKYGVNKGRFFVNPDLLVWRVDMNNEQPLFKNNPNLRKAVMHALDRRFMTAQHGFLAGKRTDQNLPYAMPGFRDFDVYSLKGPNYAKARQLAQGNLRGGKAIFYAFNRNYGPAVAQSVQFNLKQIGLDVEIKLFDRVVQNTKMGVRGEPFDLGHEGWHADYPDPSNFINVILDGRRLQAENNVNTSYFSGEGVANFAQKLDRAYAASGAQRLNLYAQLDRDIAANGAPSATYIAGNVRHLLGPDAGCYAYSPQAAIVLVSVCKK
jgi:ABC-type oligopeptide transport system substrate-binding subunit